MTMTKLNTVNEGYNKFCGPAVLSILTGKTTDECASVISGISNNYTVTGVELGHLIQAANKLGFNCESINSDSSSLFLIITTNINNDGIYIVTLQKHFIVIEISNKIVYICDNHTKEAIPAASSARLMQKVISVHKVTKKTEPKLLSDDIEIKLNEAYPNTNIRYIRAEIIHKVLYDDKDYNRLDYIGSIRARDREELGVIIQKLISAHLGL
jgi:hypothetical protein